MNASKTLTVALLPPMTVYLAGPITGLSYGDCTDWRDYAADLLAPDIACYSPMRHKEHLARERVIRDAYEEDAMTTARGIAARDRYDCTRCDLLLVNLLGAKGVSIGTCIELGWADARRTPVVLVMEPEGNPHEHPILRDIAAFRVPTIEEGVRVTRSVLLP